MSSADTFFQISAAICLFGIAFFSGFLPLAVENEKKSTTLVQLFTAGIFFGQGLLHFLPHSIERLDSSDYDGLKGGPTSFIVCGTSIIVLMFIGQINRNSLKKQQPFIPIPQEEKIERKKPIFTKSKVEMKSINAKPSAAIDFKHQKIQIEDNDDEEEEVDYNYDDSDDEEEQLQHKISQSNELDGTNSNSLSSFVVTLLAFLAISFHAFFEGFKIASNSTQDMSILIAIIAYKALTAFAIGTQLTNCDITGVQYFIATSLYSLFTPIAILVEPSISNQNEGITSATFFAIFAGALLFLALMEIIPNQLRYNKESGLDNKNCFAFFSGFGSIAFLAFLM